MERRPVGAGPRKITIKDVAQLAGVSQTTVSFVLNGRGSISYEVRERVRAAAAVLGFHPNSQARAIRTGESRTIGLIVPDLRNPFFPELVEAVGGAAQRKGYAMLIGYANDPAHERESFIHLAHHGVDGICWCPTSEVDTPLELGLTQPIVTLDRPGGDYDLVTSNARMGAELIAAEIRRCGFRSVGLVNGPGNIPAARTRSTAFAKRLKASSIIKWQIENPFSIAISEPNIRWILGNPVDAIVCANDTIAIGVLRVLKDAQISVPEETSVLGFDDIPWCSLVEPQLSTIQQDLPSIAAGAIDLLVERIADPRRDVRKTEVDVRWCGRGSTLARSEEQ
jgi:LacI family transcriptional regulator